ncbi:MAG: hypothetical protein NE334_01810 [Lentisphaeraceae bacterium]|nr:hypothetical protein [Lentisphaeraceae bacterium]
MNYTLLLTALILLGNTPLQGKEKKIKEKVSEVVKSKEGLQLLHNTFSAGCFNKTWSYLDKTELTDEEKEDMIATSYASLWHWKQRDDCKAENLSVAYWQLGRVHCVAADLSTAKSFGDKCLKVSLKGKLSPFYIGYAYELLLNAAVLNKDKNEATKYLKLANEQLELIKDKNNKKYLSDDINKLKKSLN